MGQVSTTGPDCVVKEGEERKRGEELEIVFPSLSFIILKPKVFIWVSKIVTCQDICYFFVRTFTRKV